ncbi:MAG: hypothetical protein TREMPRED_004934 [Tremellales sp. Tagirdzhanova-0007]|nr:MAG: hypothetical protein TREMPRED_004934 [Tremellales sp. Tagirdzhanova-0007]
MQFCLSHPTEGYYSKGDVFGQKGDFITSPEISQVFGELVAVWLLTRYLDAGSPERVRLVELGPGRGTLMDDVLRTLLRFPTIQHSIRSIQLVENSEKMRVLQHDQLSKYRENGIELMWTDKIDEMQPSQDYTMLVAHEYFDVMPINLFEVGERYTLPTQSSPSGLRLALARDATPLSTALPTTSRRFANLAVGTRIEVAQESWKVMRKVGELLSSNGGGGVGIVVDYGGDRTFGSSFRAFRDHKIVDVFEEPGSADLTANVDFAYLREAISDLATPLGPIPQSRFLLSLGLQPRLDKLVSSASSEERRIDIEKGAQRLVDPLGMGAQYQIMGIVSTTKEEVYPFPRDIASAPPLS